MIVERANDKTEEAIERWHQVHLKPKQGDDTYTYSGRFELEDKK
jgi:hypothetical protein